MKKIIIFAAVLLSFTMLFGCSQGSAPADTVNKGVVWSDRYVDSELVGAWYVEDDPDAELRIFTEDGRIQFVKGSVYLEGDVKYGVDSDGNKKYFSEFYYMAGELNYMVEGDRALFVSLDGVTQTLIRTNTPDVELAKFEDFDEKNPLVGKWANEEFNDSYTFNADGTATYYLNDTELNYASHIDYTYKVEDDKVHLSYDSGEGAESYISVFTISDDVLNLDGSGEYKRQ